MGTSHTVVFTFPSPVTFSGAAVTSGVATSATAVAISSTVVAVDLTGVTDVQRITVTLLGVSDGSNTNDVAVRMGILIGDTNGKRHRHASDIGRSNRFPGSRSRPANFRADVDR